MPVISGGSVPALTADRVVLTDSSGRLTTDADVAYDSTNDMLAQRHSSPTATLDIAGTMRLGRSITASTTINQGGGISSGDSTVTLTSVSGWPKKGVIKIEDEYASFTGISGSQLTGLTRGRLGTTAASHGNATLVRLAALVVAESDTATSALVVFTSGSIEFLANGLPNRDQHLLNFYDSANETGFYISPNEIILAFGGSARHKWGSNYLHVLGTAGAPLVKFGSTNGDVGIERSGTSALKVTNAGTGGGDFNIPGQNSTHGEGFTFKSVSELTTIAASAFTDTTIQIPADAVVFQVMVRVTVALPITTSFTVGVSGDTARYGSGISKAVNTTATKPGSQLYTYSAATNIRITPDTTPSDATGRVRVTVIYAVGTAPTS